MFRWQKINLLQYNNDRTCTCRHKHMSIACYSSKCLLSGVWSCTQSDCCGCVMFRWLWAWWWMPVCDNKPSGVAVVLECPRNVFLLFLRLWGIWAYLLSTIKLDAGHCHLVCQMVMRLKVQVYTCLGVCGFLPYLICCLAIIIVHAFSDFSLTHLTYGSSIAVTYISADSSEYSSIIAEIEGYNQSISAMHDEWYWLIGFT